MSENESTSVVIDAENLEQLLKTQGIKVNKMAKELGVSATELKKCLVERFGDNIEFRRGRNGGVYWIGE